MWVWQIRWLRLRSEIIVTWYNCWVARGSCEATIFMMLAAADAEANCEVIYDKSSLETLTCFYRVLTQTMLWESWAERWALFDPDISSHCHGPGVHSQTDKIDGIKSYQMRDEIISRPHFVGKYFRRSINLIVPVHVLRSLGFLKKDKRWWWTEHYWRSVWNYERVMLACWSVSLCQWGTIFGSDYLTSWHSIRSWIEVKRKAKNHRRNFGHTQGGYRSVSNNFASCE